MKKSSNITLGLVATVAMMMAACDRTQVQRCVDSNNTVVDDRNCDAPPGNTATHTGFYRWYYGGRGYRPGETAYDGDYAPRAGYSVVRGSSMGSGEHGSGVSRGGFGAHGAAHGSSS